MDLNVLLLAVPAAALLLLPVLRKCGVSLRPTLRAAGNAVLGLAALMLIHTAGGEAAWVPGINLFNALVVGILGIPGLGLLFLVQWVLT